RFSPWAAAKLVRFLRTHRIAILHAHSTSVFIAALAARFSPGTRLVWHDHFGRHDVEARPAWLYRPPVRRAAGVIAVSPQLAEWSRCVLGVEATRVCYLPNFVVADDGGREPASELPGVAGRRIVCVANLRPQKDHGTLVRAMAEVVERVPESHLLLVGQVIDPRYGEEIRRRIRHHRIEESVTLLGERRDVAAILRSSDVAVLSSVSEGMPLALLEYGAAAVPVVATRVGRCPEILDEGEAGRLVSPGDAQGLAAALTGLLRDPGLRRRLADALHRRVHRQYSPEAVISRLHDLYDTVLNRGGEIA
ncbi:MAG: glycosyltransferase family 4 protein, partial [bacterium]|nr:glycosyltransferase family 4 protein [bacterium]